MTTQALKNRLILIIVLLLNNGAAGLLMLCENPGEHIAVNVTARGDDSGLLTGNAG
jgi:hypothetical protein